MRKPKYTYDIGVKINGTKLVPRKLIKLPRKRGGNWAYELECDCGNMTIQPISALRSGSVKTCRCGWIERGQNKRFTMDQVRDAFLEKVETANGNDACWGWNGCKNDDGYGIMVFRGRGTGAHRISWTLNRGEIPKGVHVLHSCDNPPCCNPKHLFLGTQDDNMKDCARKGRIVSGGNIGDNHSHAKLNGNQVLTVRNLSLMGWSYARIAIKFNVSSGCIGDIVRRKNWKHI